MVLNWFGVNGYHERQIAEIVKSIPKHGTTVENIMLLFESLGWNVDGHASQDTKFNTVVEFERFVIKHIDAGLSIMVDWAEHW